MPAEQVEYLVIGSGISGLTFALEAAKHGRVLIVTKAKREESATLYAQGGIAAALGEWDLPANHLDDTLAAGAGLCDRKVAEIMVTEGVDRVKELIQGGMEITREKGGKVHLGREGGHGQHRIVHTYDYTGRALEEFLLHKAMAQENIEIREHQVAIDLITEHQVERSGDIRPAHCYGAYVLDVKSGNIYTVASRFTLLATGGAGQVYPYTTNPAVSTGDGIAMGYRAGCSVRNMEFVQFHPTALYTRELGGEDEDRIFLITEALRGDGALLRLRNGERFMDNYHDQAELAPRDVVARAIDFELKKSGESCVYLDITHEKKEKIIEHFPQIYNTLLERFGLDMSRQMVPVVPAAHYLCGGLLVGLSGETGLNSLYAVGETASTGVHGGNRLASNSLLEGLVFATRAAEHARKAIETQPNMQVSNIPDWDPGASKKLAERIYVKHDRAAIQDIMWDYVGIVRSDERLHIALRRIDIIYELVKDIHRRTFPTRELLELRNQALVAQLIVRSALHRKESRGLHYTTDYPESREPSRADTILEPMITRTPTPDPSP